MDCTGLVGREEGADFLYFTGFLDFTGFLVDTGFLGVTRLAGIRFIPFPGSLTAN